MTISHLKHFLESFEKKLLENFPKSKFQNERGILKHKEAASKPSGLNTLSNKKCFVGRTVMLQTALHFPDLGDFTYSERMRTTHEKFSTGF